VTPEQLEEELAGRCFYTFMLERDSDASDDDGGMAIGAIVVADDGSGFLAVEVGLTADGHAQVTARGFDADGGVREPVVVELAGTVMISSLDTCQSRE